jgi:hypothetical protein
MIMGWDLISGLKLIMDFDTKSITWDYIINQPMNLQGGGETNHPLRGSILSIIEPFQCSVR